MFFSKPKTKAMKVKLKLCPLINNPCVREGCMMYRKTVTGAGYCGLAARDNGECFKLDFEEAVED
jgi:hypothetical protein